MSNSLTLGPIGQISRSVGNIEESIDWYKNKVRLPHLYTYGRLAFFDCGGTRRPSWTAQHSHVDTTIGAEAPAPVSWV